MLSSRTKQFLVSCIANKDIADDVEKRLELQALSSYSQDLKKIREWLVVALANKQAGDLLADKLAQAATCLEAQSAQEAEVPAVKASFDAAVAGVTGNVELEADVAGVDGNDILLIGDGDKDLDTLVSEWNALNEENEVSLLSANGADVPELGEEMQLEGGADLIPAVDGLPAAQAAFNSEAFSAEFMKILVVAMADRAAAQEIEAKHNALIAAVAALS